MTSRQPDAGGRRSLAASARRAAAATGALLLLAGCGGKAPEVPVGPDGQPDPVLEAGRGIYGARCASCHGNDGGGGRGRQLSDGEAVERYPDVDDMIAVIAQGKGSGMPAFEASLDEDELEAVTRYIREVL